MTTRIWPADGDKEAWPIYRGSDGHLADGQGEAADFGNKLGLPVLALADGDYVTLTNSGDCGNLVLLHLLDDDTYHTFCHLDRHAPFTNDCTAGQVLGWVGWTGLVRPPGPAGAHLHWWIWKPGVGRIRPEDYIAQHEWVKPQEDDMTEYEQQQLQKAWDSAEELEAQATAEEADAALRRAEAKAIKNAVRMAKGEAVEQ